VAYLYDSEAVAVKVYPRGSVEFHETPLLDEDGEAVAPDDVCATPWNTAPTDEWDTPVTLEDKQGLMVGTYDPGYYRTWARVDSNPETPIVESEPFTVR
jgi:hypothetical protein